MNVTACQFAFQAFKSARRIGQEVASKVREPAIWPAKVEIKDSVKKAGAEFGLPLCIVGEARMMKPNI